MMAKAGGAADKELAAIGIVLQALHGLDGESIQRVLDYVLVRLSIGGPQHSRMSSTAQVATLPPIDATVRRESIRDLKDAKQPESSNQMAALVAYYLSEVAQDGERKDAVNTADLERYFKQAGFKLPKSIPQTLSNAAAAGYFDPTGSGLYKLNAVGYNLVANGLPRTHKSPTKRTLKPKRKPLIGSKTKKKRR